MKALAILLGVLLVLAHPAAAATVLGAELAGCAVLCRVLARRFRSHPYPRRLA